MRLLVCGGRGFDDEDLMFGWLNDLHHACGFTVVIHGAARGADSMAGTWGRSMGLPVEEYPADWENLGKAAGAARNTLMLTEGRPDFVVAFPHPDWSTSRGTKDMVTKALSAKVTTIVVL